MVWTVDKDLLPVDVGNCDGTREGGIGDDPCVLLSKVVSLDDMEAIVDSAIVDGDAVAEVVVLRMGPHETETDVSEIKINFKR